MTAMEMGWRMPAEWEGHEATWLAWPHELTDWPGKFAPIPWAFAEIVRHLTRVDRVWLRDSGPICVKNAAGEVAYNNFVFNGWAKYGNHKKDAAVVAKANRRLKRHVILPEWKWR